MDFVIVIVLSVFPPTIAVLSFFWYKKRNRAGTDVLVMSLPDMRAYGGNGFFDAASGRTWYRVRLVFKRKTNVVAGNHRYRLSISDSAGLELYAEEQTVENFFSFCWRRAPQASAPGEPYWQCDAIVLEFALRGPGRYGLGMHMFPTAEPCDIWDISVRVSRGVTPTRDRALPHRSLDLRKNNCPHVPQRPGS